MTGCGEPGVRISVSESLSDVIVCDGSMWPLVGLGGDSGTLSGEGESQRGSLLKRAPRSSACLSVQQMGRTKSDAPSCSWRMS